jgi:hypothetical protein
MPVMIAIQTCAQKEENLVYAAAGRKAPMATL